MNDSSFYDTKPIADLFTNATVINADISGFTAWSSTCEPTQVFILLETIYRAFDEIAAKRRIYKVETEGDCYVAVSGVPDSRKDHAVAMARFAVDCMHRMHALTRKLEVMLGPDTADLSLRVGIHSGPVTAGVLRGERSRFQLFGDTMNTASRMESNGIPGKIQISEDIAVLLRDAGKETWFHPRADKIVAKEKGSLQTYWLDMNRSSNDVRSERRSTDNSSSGEGDPTVGVSQVDQTALSSKQMRLVQWNVDVLGSLLKKVIAHREEGEKSMKSELRCTKSTPEPEMTVLEEVKEIVELPDAIKATANPEEVVFRLKWRSNFCSMSLP